MYNNKNAIILLKTIIFTSVRMFLEVLNQPIIIYIFLCQTSYTQHDLIEHYRYLTFTQPN